MLAVKAVAEGSLFAVESCTYNIIRIGSDHIEQLSDARREPPMQEHTAKTLRAIFSVVIAATALAWCFSAPFSALAQAPSAVPGASQPTILYGAAYYNEYMPADLQPGRLEKDVALMKAAGITVVRMGESTWSLWEPADGHFEYAWMDRVVDAMGKAGIKVIMGTPTYSIPTWMAHAHPEILARPLGGGSVGYGMRQNMDFDNPKFRLYAERVISNLVSHYKDNPAVIGWQIDNETASYGASNHDVFAGFVDHLKQKFGTTDALNKAWFLNYWGEDVKDWADMPTRDNATSTSYKLEWTRWQQIRVTNFLAWQAALVRKFRRPDQFVTQDFGSMMRSDVDEPAVAAALDVVANNPYHGTQEHLDGAWQALQGDFSRSLKHTNYLVTETNAQTLGWDSAGQFPPYDGQLRLDVYTTSPAAPTWWSTGIGTRFMPVRKPIGRACSATTSNPIALTVRLLASRTNFRRLARTRQYEASRTKSLFSTAWTRRTASASCRSSGREPHVDAGQSVGSLQRRCQPTAPLALRRQRRRRFRFPNVTAAELAQYKLLIVPCLYVADDALLHRISDYVHGGGHVLMTFKSGFTNENSAVRWELAPGPAATGGGISPTRSFPIWSSPWR